MGYQVELLPTPNSANSNQHARISHGALSGVQHIYAAWLVTRSELDFFNVGDDLPRIRLLILASVAHQDREAHE
ncbi:hypothetical protein E2651_08270 [Streptomyces sp. MZ04]|nr:hypothetical protein E2651_08270 [Streptomyces sp. MZ04]